MWDICASSRNDVKVLRHYHEGWTAGAGRVNNILGSDPTNFLTEPENSLYFIIGPLSQPEGSKSLLS